MRGSEVELRSEEGQMGFAEFAGNQRVVTALQGMLTADRVPHAMLFSGPRGVGKYTLAVMFAQAANCARRKDDFCGECEPCRRIGLLAEPAPLVEQGLAQRGESADAAMVERVPLILQTHPDVWSIVPDPMRLRNPVARPGVFILDGAETMRWDLANIFLKILEEPPESATLILLAPNPYLLLSTIRSRCLQFYFAPLSTEQLEEILKRRTQLKPSERKLAAQLAEGSPGRAMHMDLEGAAQLRRDVLQVLERAVE